MDKRTKVAKPFNETIIWWNQFPNRNMNIFHIERAGITKPDSQYRIVRKRCHSTYDSLFVIEYVTAGKGYIESEGKRAAVQAGDLYIINRRTNHCYYADEEDPFEKKWINISGKFLNSILLML